MTRFPECPLWDFSIAVYARQGVASACLSLQERYRIDVNLLLYCCWLGAEGCRSIDDRDIERAIAFVESWHKEIVRGLRRLRQRLKHCPEPAPADLAEALRKKIGAVEIEAEHIEQILLHGLTVPAKMADSIVDKRVACAAENARAYLARLGAAFDARDIDDLQAVLAGCFPELDRNLLARLFAEH